MQIMFEKLYGTYLGSTTQMCFVQFLEHDPRIFAYNISEYIVINLRFRSYGLAIFINKRDKK